MTSRDHLRKGSWLNEWEPVTFRHHLAEFVGNWSPLFTTLLSLLKICYNFVLVFQYYTFHSSNYFIYHHIQMIVSVDFNKNFHCVKNFHFYPWFDLEIPVDYIFYGDSRITPWFNPFVTNTSFLYPLETSESLTVFWCFHRVENWCIGRNGS